MPVTRVRDTVVTGDLKVTGDVDITGNVKINGIDLEQMLQDIQAQIEALQEPDA